MKGKLKKKKATIFWALCLFFAFHILISNIQAVNATIDPYRILTSSDIPDPILLAKLTTLADTDHDGNLTVGELASYTENLDLSNLNITSIQGLGFASGTPVIDLSGNNTLTTIPDNVFKDSTTLTKVILPDSIQSIGDSAFEGCTSLNVINLPAKLTTIGAKSFLQTTNLKSVSLPATIASIGDSAFSGCGLTSIVIPNPDLSLGISVFNGAASLTSASLPEGMKIIPMETFKATGLMNITLPKSITTIGEGAFSLSNLAIIDLTNNINLTAIKTAAFSGTPVTSVILPDSLTELGSRAFENCPLLPQITIPSKITVINSLTFSYNTSLVNVAFTPAGINDYKLQEIGPQAFYGDYKLCDGNVQFLANLNNLTSIGDSAFAYTGRDTGLKDQNNQPIYTGIQTIALPDSLLAIGNSAFSGSYALKQFKIPDKVSEIKPQTFKNCYSLSDITWPQLLTNIGASAFEGDKSLTSLSIPESVTDIGAYAFKGNSNLISVTLPANLTKLNDGVFRECGKLTTINLPSTLTSIGNYTFYKDSNLFSDGTTLVIPDTVTSIGSYAFYGDSSIQGILRVPDKVTTIQTSTFEGTGFSVVELPDALTSIGNNSFKNCNSLISVSLPASTAFVSTGFGSSFWGSYNFSNAIVRPVPTDIPVKENTSAILPVKVFSSLNLVVMGDENIATGMLDQTKPQVTVNGVKSGQTTATVKGTIQYQTGTDPYSGSSTINRFDSQVQFNVAVTALKATSASFPQSVRGMKLNSTITLTPTILPTDTTDLKQFSSDNPLVATVSNTGVVTAVGYGTTTIRLKVGDLPEVQCQVYVVAPASGLSLDKTAATLIAGQSVSIVPTVTYSSIYDNYKNAYPEVILWSSSAPNVATVNESGVVTAVGYGIATITARADAGGISRTSRITVTPESSSITFNKTSLSLLKGNSDTLTMTLTPSDLPLSLVSVTSSNPLVASVSVNKNVVTVIGQRGGTARITAKPVNGIAATCDVSVISPITSITASPMTINKGALRTISIIKTPTDATDVLVYSSNNPSVAKVDSYGRVTGVSAGSAIIHISSQSNPSVSADFQVTVVVPVTRVSLSAANAILYNQNSVQLTATVAPSDATNKKVIWSSSNPNVASVYENGLVKPVSPGTAIIKVSTVDGNYSAMCNVTVVNINEVTIKATDGTAHEGGTDTGTFTVTRTFGSTLAALTVNYTISGTATNGLDYNTLNGSVIIPAGSTTATITVTPKKDTLLENNETVTITLAQSSAYIVGSAKSATLQIYDNPPTGLTAKGVNKNQINLSWQALTGATRYNIYRATSQAGTYNYLGTSTSTVFNNTGLSANSIYWYKVSAVNSMVEGPESTEVSGKTLAVSSVAAPTGLNAMALSSNQINLNWTAVTSAIRYNVYRATSQTGPYSYIGSSNTNAFSNIGLANNTIYWYKVSAVNNTGEGPQSIAVKPLIVTRLGGSNRRQTAIEVSKEGWKDGSTVVILARDDSFPDALAGTPLAHKYNAPILLTNSNTLSIETAKEIDRLKPTKVIILGSPGAVSSTIEQQLKVKYQVNRLGGSDRFETALKIAEALGSKGKAVIAYGFNFPDALAISPWAAYNKIPILLTDTNKLPGSTAMALKELAVTQTIVVGSTGVIGDTVTHLLPNPTRYCGSNRYQTAMDIAKRLGCDANTLFVATGSNFPDALAGSALAARTGSAIILVDDNLSEPMVNKFLTENQGKVNDIYVLGSEGVVSQTIVDKIYQLVK